MESIKTQQNVIHHDVELYTLSKRNPAPRSGDQWNLPINKEPSGVLVWGSIAQDVRLSESRQDAGSRATP